jgi:hypothetical protein
MLLTHLLTVLSALLSFGCALQAADTSYELISAAGFYGGNGTGHYKAFVRDAAGMWRLMDDASARLVPETKATTKAKGKGQSEGKSEGEDEGRNTAEGSWDAVKEMCVGGRTQLTMLLYSRVDTANTPAVAVPCACVPSASSSTGHRGRNSSDGAAGAWGSRRESNSSSGSSDNWPTVAAAAAAVGGAGAGASKQKPAGGDGWVSVGRGKGRGRGTH